MDGAASVLHMGITLSGRRTLRLERASGDLAPDVVVPNHPGRVYLGVLTGPRHGVQHEEASGDDAMQGVSVTCMLRCGLFPFNRARLRQAEPTPKIMWHSTIAVFNHWLSHASLVLPLLRDVLAQADILPEASDVQEPRTRARSPSRPPAAASASKTKRGQVEASAPNQGQAKKKSATARRTT